MQDRAWCESRTSILEGMQCNLAKLHCILALGTSDMVEEEDEESTEGVNSDGYHRLVSWSCLSLHTHLVVEERLERRGRPENRYITGME